MLTLKGMTMHPRCHHIGACLHIKSKFEFKTFLDFFFQIFGFQCFSTHEDLSIDISITNVGLILIIDEAKVISALQPKSK